MKHALVLAIALTAAPALAAPQADVPGVRTYGLTDEQKARLNAAMSEDAGDLARAGLPGGTAGRQIHGEIGAVIGTGGTRGVFGTAAVPLGETGSASFSFENSRLRDYRYPY